MLPQERIAKVKPFWATVPQEECLKLLSIPVSELKQRAAEVGARQRREQGGQAALRLRSQQHRPFTGILMCPDQNIINHKCKLGATASRLHSSCTLCLACGWVAASRSGCLAQLWVLAASRCHELVRPASRLDPTAPPVVAMVSLWLGTRCCSFPHLRVRAAAAAERAARVAVGLAPLVYNPTVDEVVSVGIQRLQQSRTWKLWRWPLAAKEFLDAKEFR